MCEYALNQKDKSVTPNDIMRFPSAQPEVIHCKDCKHYRTSNAFGVPLHKEEYFCDADNYPKNDPGEEQRELPEWWFCAGAQTERSGSYDSLMPSGDTIPNGKRKEDEG